MEITSSLYVKNRTEWRNWLIENHEKKKEIWLIRYRKSSNKESIPYDESVEEAMCFGWIDSTAKAIDDEKYAQKFTPRRNHVYSQLNKERLKLLLKDNQVKPSLAKELAYILEEKYVFPKYILDEIRKNKTAWANFQKFSEPYKRIRIAYIGHREDNPEEYKKRLNSFIKSCEKNKMLGIQGMEKYF